MDDAEVVRHISQLVEEEHELRGRAATSGGLDAAGRERITALEVQLDQYWDLLRRRQAREQYGQDPDQEHERSADEVEHYRQ
jgi:hypothetical protein